MDDDKGHRVFAEGDIDPADRPHDDAEPGQPGAGRPKEARRCCEAIGGAEPADGGGAEGEGAEAEDAGQAKAPDGRETLEVIVGSHVANPTNPYEQRPHHQSERGDSDRSARSTVCCCVDRRAGAWVGPWTGSRSLGVAGCHRHPAKGSRHKNHPRNAHYLVYVQGVSSPETSAEGSANESGAAPVAGEAQGGSAADFIRAKVTADSEANRFNGRVQTRFPPEPNGFLHIGHAKSICLNFAIAAETGGLCNLRFDDTNPETEDEVFVDAIEADLEWLGFRSASSTKYASDYFEQLYKWAADVGQQRPGLRRRPRLRLHL